MITITPPLPINPTPLLLLIDIQQEYVAKGRPFCLNGIEPALENCRSILAHGRENQWPIVHVRFLQESHLFNKELPYSRFIEGFEPLAHEMVFTKHMFSCFSDPEFTAFMGTALHHPIYVMGFNAQMCCLSTVVDAQHRGMRLNFINDASLARATALGDEQQSHAWIMEIMSVYAEIVDTETVLSGFGKRRSTVPEEGMGAAKMAVRQ